MPIYVYVLLAGQSGGHRSMFGVYSSHAKALAVTLSSDFYLNWSYEIIETEIK